MDEDKLGALSLGMIGSIYFSVSLEGTCSETYMSLDLHWEGSDNFVSITVGLVSIHIT